MCEVCEECDAGYNVSTAAASHFADGKTHPFDLNNDLEKVNNAVDGRVCF